MKNLNFAYLFVLFFVVIGNNPAQESSIDFPNTPVGKRAKEVVELINSGDSLKVEKYVNNDYAQDLRDALPIVQHVGIFNQMYTTRSVLKLYKVEAASENSINFILLSSKTNSLLNVHLETELADPYLITRIGFRPGGEPERSSNEKNEMNVEEEKEAIQEVIQAALVDGYLNNYDVDEMEKGIHPEFRSMEVRNNSLSQRRYEDLLAYVERVKPIRPHGRRVKVTVEFLMVDVIGNIGCAKVEFYDGATLHGTDFITLMRFDDGWKILGAIAYEH